MNRSEKITVKLAEKKDIFSNEVLAGDLNKSIKILNKALTGLKKGLVIGAHHAIENLVKNDLNSLDKRLVFRIKRDKESK